MEIELNDKCALVTGASSGIGAAIAELLASSGARVAVHARTLEKATNTVEKIEASGGRAIAVEADLTDVSATKDMCDAAVKGLGGVDIVVNNAGFYAPAMIAEEAEDVWNKTMLINLEAPRLITRYTVPIMIDQGRGGRQIYVSSLSALMAEYQGGPYCASKAGLNAMARCLAVEVGKHGITVNTINPGWVDTPMSRKAFAEMQGDEKVTENLVQETMSENTLKVVVKPSDIAGMATYLASEHGRCITGQDINVCAGLSLLRYGDE